MNHEMKAWPDERLDSELVLAQGSIDPMPEAAQWVKDLEAEKARRLPKIGQRAADKAKARRKSVMGGAWPRAVSGRFVTGKCPQCTVRNGKHEVGCPVEYQRRNLR